MHWTVGGVQKGSLPELPELPISNARSGTETERTALGMTHG